MTRKDYVMIAEAIRDAGLSARIKPTPEQAAVAEDAVRRAADYIADGCKADNVAFDRRRFLTACGFSA